MSLVPQDVSAVTASGVARAKTGQLRQTGYWIGLLLLLLFALCLVIAQRHWQYLYQEAERSAEQELSFIKAVLGEALQAGNLRDTPELVARWGALSEATTRLRVSAANGFVLGEYRRVQPAAFPIQRQTQVRFGYRGQALIALEKDLAPVKRAHRTLLWELAAGYLLIAGALAAFGRLMLQRQREAIALDGLNQRLQREIAQRREVEAQLRGEEERFRELIEHVPNVAVQGYDGARRLTYWNAASTRLYGYTREEALGRRLEDLIIPHSLREETVSGIQAWIDDDVAVPAAELELRHKDGHTVPVYSSHVLLGRSRGRPEIFSIDVDLAEQKQAQAELHRLASFDAVTGLPNRTHLEHALRVRLQEARRFERVLGVLFIDLDNFKAVNDTLGHAEGDLLLRSVAARLSAVLRAYDFLARFGGDEFILLVGPLAETEQVWAIAQKLITRFAEPFPLTDNETYVTASVGVALFPKDGTDSSALLRHADAAMYRAKEAGRNRIAFYCEDLNRDLSRQHALTAGLRRALYEERFELVYQPQVNLASGAIVACEALLRWTDPDLGAVSPSELIPLAEKSDLIERIGSWVIERVSRDLATLHSGSARPVRIDINLSGRQLRFGNVLEALDAALARCELGPHALGLELTENVLIDAQTPVLKQLRGRYVALDDFGTGYSSLSYLKRLPIDTIKIDRAFVSDLPGDRDDAAIVSAIVAMGHSLGLTVLAEGVETVAQRDFLSALGCDQGQGYLFHRPMPLAALLACLARD